jgi:cyclopropane fatty-acyl-phospholipid synthase-like methyltransferase
MRVPERLRAVVEQLDIRPEDRVLEIGCDTASLPPWCVSFW